MEQPHTSQLKRTALYDAHVALGAKMVPFAGWSMPLQYTSVIDEHLNVRSKAGLFDVSHMGCITIQGPDTLAFIEYLMPIDSHRRPNGHALYGVMCNEQGGAIDDLIVLKMHEHKCHLIVNASNREKDLKHILKQQQGFSVEITFHDEDWSILALQGPHADAIAERLFPGSQQMKVMQVQNRAHPEGIQLILSKTGYTGSGGCELFVPTTNVQWLWDRLLSEGQKYGIKPIGLGARDTLRLEMGYALYGHELTEAIAPTESVAAWSVHLHNPFIGKEALLKRDHQKRFPYGIIVSEGIPREGYRIFASPASDPIGWITSGSYGPSIEKGIGLILISQPLKRGDSVFVEIRNRLIQATIVPLPFYKPQKIIPAAQ